MRIAYVCADRGIPVFGVKGCSLHVQEVLRTLVMQDMAVELFAATTRGEAAPDLQHIPVHKIRGDAVPERSVREQADLAANDDMVAHLHRHGPFDLVYERYSLWSMAGMRYARQLGIPGVLEVNAPLIDEQEKYRGLIDRASAEQVARECFRDARLLVAVSEGVADYLDGFTEARGKIQVIPNGVNPARFADDRVYRTGSDDVFTIGFVGTLKPWHGLNNLMDAFAALHKCCAGVRLLLVGDGPEAENLKARIARESLGDVVELTGAVSPEDMPAQLARMDVGTAPYAEDSDFYFSPLKVYEYMAAGLPVVASCIGQLDGLVTHGHDGLLHTPGDVAALTRALTRLAEERSIGERLGRAARQTIIASHSWDSRVQDILQLAMAESMPQAARGSG